MTKKYKTPHRTFNGKTLYKVLIYLALIALMIFTFFPIVYAVLASFKSNREFLAGVGGLLPEKWMFENYAIVWNKLDFSKYFFNSIYISVFGTIAVLFASSIMGYCLERCNFKGKRLIMGMYLGTMFIAGGMSLYPNFELFVDLGLAGNINGLVLLRLGNQAANAFLICGALKNIPIELDEAAKIDGCSFFRRYWQITLPLLRPIMATIAILTFLACWNEYMMNMAFSLSNENLRSLTVAVVALKNEMGTSVTPYNYMFAGATISIIPMVIVFFILNKQIIQGMTSGAVKG